MSDSVSGAKNSGPMLTIPLNAPKRRDAGGERTDVSRATGVLPREMTISSPASTRARSLDRFAFAARIFTVTIGRLLGAAQHARQSPSWRPSPLRTKRETWLRSAHVARPDSFGARSRAQPRSDACRRARDRGCGRSWAVARHRRRGLRQDGDARAPGRGADPRRRRSEAHHAGDVLAPRRSRAWPARRAVARTPPCARSRGRRDARLFGHVSCDRRTAPARIRAAPRA